MYERLEEMDSDSAESNASVILAGLGFTKEMMGQTTKEFSGGWRCAPPGRASAVLCNVHLCVLCFVYVVSCVLCVLCVLCVCCVGCVCMSLSLCCVCGASLCVCDVLVCRGEGGYIRSHVAKAMMASTPIQQTRSLALRRAAGPKP